MGICSLDLLQHIAKEDLRRQFVAVLVSEEIKVKDFRHVAQNHTIRQNKFSEFTDSMKEIRLLTRKRFRQSPKTSVMKMADGYVRKCPWSQNS
jgi:hypothetical protein